MPRDSWFLYWPFGELNISRDVIKGSVSITKISMKSWKVGIWASVVIMWLTVSRDMFQRQARHGYWELIKEILFSKNWSKNTEKSVFEKTLSHSFYHWVKSATLSRRFAISKFLVENKWQQVTITSQTTWCNIYGFSFEHFLMSSFLPLVSNDKEVASVYTWKKIMFPK